jgi:hypothetical protein
MKLFNLQSEVLTSVQAKSGDVLEDIAVTRDVDLLYTGFKTINLVKNNKTRTVIKLEGWRPANLCCTAAGDLLVALVTDDCEQISKVMRYSGFKQKQTIQFDDQGKSLFSCDIDTKFISENINLAICVADCGDITVVVVNQSGKLRFRYSGHPSDAKISFQPRSLTTDSEGHILIADYNYHNDYVHVLDQDGQFFRYIPELSHPFGLCVDFKDNLYVAEINPGKVRKIRYL